MKPEMIRTILEDIYRTFPDYYSELKQSLEQGDTIVTMSLDSGAHLGVAQTTFNGGLLRGTRPMRQLGLVPDELPVELRRQ